MRKQNPGFSGILFFFLLLAGGVHSEALEMGLNAILSPYDLIDPRLCHLTPRPFLCQACLSRGDEFVRILSFEEDGRPLRTYACRSGKKNRSE